MLLTRTGYVASACLPICSAYIVNLFVQCKTINETLMQDNYLWIWHQLQRQFGTKLADLRSILLGGYGRVYFTMLLWIPYTEIYISGTRSSVLLMKWILSDLGIGSIWLVSILYSSYGYILICVFYPQFYINVTCLGFCICRILLIIQLCIFFHD